MDKIRDICICLPLRFRPDYFYAYSCSPAYDFSLSLLLAHYLDFCLAPGPGLITCENDE